MSLKSFIWDTISEGKNPSSKRVAGIVGWIVCVFNVIYCTLSSVQAPEIMDTFMICTVALLGVDSVVSMFKKTTTLTKVDNTKQETTK